MFKQFTIVLGLVLSLTSCAHQPVKKNMDNSSARVTGIVLDQEALVQGGDLGLTPFKAGPAAEANDELDRISGMIVKGVKDCLEKRKSPLHIIDATQGQPKIVLEGYVKDLYKTTRMSRVLKGANLDSITLEGDLWLTSNGKQILSFYLQRKFNRFKEKLDDAAYAAGWDIGEFIVAQIAKENP